MIYVYANLVYYSLFMVNLLMLWAGVRTAPGSPDKKASDNNQRLFCFGGAFVVLILNAIRLSQIILS